jgi:predicted nucleic acid-binding protein
MSAVTGDTGFLIGLERAKPRAIALLVAARRRSLLISIPAVVVAEWWRGARDQAKILKLVEVDAMTERLAKSAGEALAAVAGATVVDAIVMASAAARGSVVYTSDFEDLARLREQHFRDVRVLAL